MKPVNTLSNRRLPVHIYIIVVSILYAQLYDYGVIGSLILHVK